MLAEWYSVVSGENHPWGLCEETEAWGHAMFCIVFARLGPNCGNSLGACRCQSPFMQWRVDRNRFRVISAGVPALGEWVGLVEIQHDAGHLLATRFGRVGAIARQIGTGIGKLVSCSRGRAVCPQVRPPEQ